MTFLPVHHHFAREQHTSDSTPHISFMPGAARQGHHISAIQALAFRSDPPVREWRRPGRTAEKFVVLYLFLMENGKRRSDAHIFRGLTKAEQLTISRLSGGTLQQLA